jgi:TRAP-type mannitol/chloroaromatic compound transport system permease small subunit
LFFALPCLVILIWYSFGLWELSFNQNEGSDSLTGVGMRWIIKFFLPIGFCVTLAAVLVTMIRLAAFLFGNEWAKQDALRGLEIFADDHAELEAARLAAEEALRVEAARKKKGH